MVRIEVDPKHLCNYCGRERPVKENVKESFTCEKCGAGFEVVKKTPIIDIRVLSPPTKEPRRRKKNKAI